MYCTLNVLSDLTVLGAWFNIGERDPHILVPFFGYLAAVFLIAILAHRRLHRPDDFESEYYVGGRSFGAWVLAMSWVATLASGGSFLGYPSLVYSYGWSMAFWVSGSTVTALVGLGIVGKRINRLARQTGALTLVDLLRARFHSRSLGSIYALIVVFVTSVYLIAQFVAGARILQSILQTSYSIGLVAFAVAVVAYTTYGGFRAVAWTDTLQGILMIIGIVVLVPFAVNAVGGLERATMTGPRALAKRADPVAEVWDEESPRHEYLYLPGPRRIPSTFADDAEGPRPDRPAPEPWLPIGMGISMFVLRSLGSVVMPTTVPRMLAFKDTRALRRAMILVAPYFLLMYGSSLISMNCAYGLDLGLSADQSDQAVPALARAVAPRWLAGLLVAAPFAAVMSTVDSALLVISSSIVRDLVQQTRTTRLSTRATKILSYSVTGLAGLFAMLVAWQEPIFLQPLVIYYVAGGASALFWPSLATLFWTRATATGVVSGLVGGATVFVVMDIWRPLDHLIGIHPFVYGFVASAACVYFGSRLSTIQPDGDLHLFFGKVVRPK